MGKKQDNYNLLEKGTDEIIELETKDSINVDEIPIPNESKEDRFKRIANRRVDKILNQIKLIGNLANKSLYAYSKEQIDKIFTALDESIETSKAKFNLNQLDKTITKFSL